jgi:hypothetical protein
MRCRKGKKIAMIWGLVFSFVFLAAGALAFAYLVKGRA